MPQVSVIIPTRNRAHFLRTAIASVLNQTFQHFELVVVDDASSDNTREIVAAFQDQRIKYFRHGINKGGSAARNTGILNSSGEYIAFLDDDDEWLPEKLAKQIEVLRSSDLKVGAVYTGYLDIEAASGRVIGQQIPSRRGNLSAHLLAENCVGSASSVLMKRDCFDRVGLFDEDLPCSQDYDLWIRVAKEYFFECVQLPLFKYSVHENKISTDADARYRGLNIIKEKYRSSPLSKKYYTKVYNDLGTAHCLAGDMKKGRKAFLTAIGLSPIQTKGYVNLCLSFLGSKQFAKAKEAVRKAIASIATDTQAN
jgi:glycosyltransferase involved in cell wall biosynthesis